jgi:hypothetical protein
MDGLTGLSGLAGYQQTIDTESQATPEQRSGDVADPRHATIAAGQPPIYLSKSMQAAEMHGPYGPQNQLLDDSYWFWEPAGNPRQDPMMDNTPSKRAAPWPKGISSGRVPSEGPDDIGNQLDQSYAIHRINFGASKRMQLSLNAQQDEWDELWEVDSGNSDQPPLEPRSISSGFMWGTRDRQQSMARQNGFGFDSSHKHRRYATGPIPGNTMWMLPGGRPLAKSLPGPARPAIGSDSPFAGQDLGEAFGINGAMLQNVPTEYVAPPQPNLAAAVQPSGYDASEQWW